MAQWAANSSSTKLPSGSFRARNRRRRASICRQRVIQSGTKPQPWHVRRPKDVPPHVLHVMGSGDFDTKPQSWARTALARRADTRSGSASGLPAPVARRSARHRGSGSAPHPGPPWAAPPAPPVVPRGRARDAARRSRSEPGSQGAEPLSGRRSSGGRKGRTRSRRESYTGRQCRSQKAALRSAISSSRAKSSSARSQESASASPCRARWHQERHSRSGSGARRAICWSKRTSFRLSTKGIGGSGRAGTTGVSPPLPPRCS